MKKCPIILTGICGLACLNGAWAPWARASEAEEAQQLLAEVVARKEAHEFLVELIRKTLAKPAAASPAASTPTLSPPLSLREQTTRLHEKALARVAEKKLPEARKIYEEIILLNPNDDEAYIILGHVNLLLEHYDEARQAFRSAVDIHPDNVHEITPFYENMILQNPQDDNAYTYLGYAYLFLGETARAESAFLDALSINPANARALQGLEQLQPQAG